MDLALILLYGNSLVKPIDNNVSYTSMPFLTLCNICPQNFHAPFLVPIPQGKPLPIEWYVKLRRQTFTIINLIPQSGHDTRHDAVAFLQGCFNLMYSQARTLN